MKKSLYLKKSRQRLNLPKPTRTKLIKRTVNRKRKMESLKKSQHHLLKATKRKSLIQVQKNLQKMLHRMKNPPLKRSVQRSPNNKKKRLIPKWKMSKIKQVNNYLCLKKKNNRQRTNLPSPTKAKLMKRKIIRRHKNKIFKKRSPHKIRLHLQKMTLRKR